MKVKFFLTLIFSLIFASVCAAPDLTPEQIHAKLKPYFIPKNHPIKAKLDEIFSAERVSLTSSTLKAAGFKDTKPRKFSHTIVTQHPKLHGYLLKLFSDDQDVEEWLPLYNRIRGAHLAQKSIKKHGYQDLFKVPKKWIYHLPKFPAPPPGYKRKKYILVVENMRILKRAHNHLQWEGVTLTRKHLDAFYTIVEEVGLNDSVHGFNVPFCKDGKIAFIDTEHYHNWPIHFDSLSNYLSEKMFRYLQTLIRNGGPKSGG